ncbi:DUF3889 domain-containing protein [Oceanobacillus sp. J11TS1]|uniref:DUF3889 domain-containing protein n=1 Tax=Oceanobacillus sp. J11TS1 TaxID=2807191 RepID=UPI001B18EB5D|nr:DUF3889 domain-containing protein [Oceanobacillus sp. J11TS1]GIO23938.1 hypothetical protein J11TS1_25190 [Oceanobacillus sp. J11TS1]
MKRMYRVVVFVSIIMIPLLIGTWVNAEEPEYAPWGQVAMKEVKAKYPQEKIVDYLHVGRQSEGETTVETFKLWLVGEKKEFGVIIDIYFKTSTQEIIEIKMKETQN